MADHGATAEMLSEHDVECAAAIPRSMLQLES